MKCLLLLVFLFTSHSVFANGNRSRYGQQTPASWISQRFERIPQSDLLAARNRYRSEACYIRNGTLQVSCGERSEWVNGDPSYDWDPYYSEIPRGTPVDVNMRCNPSTGKFYMNVQVNLRVCDRGANGQADPSTCRTQPHYMHNPYTAGGGAFLQRGVETQWTMSPGLYPETQTTLPEGQPIRSDRMVVTQYHRVSEAQQWSGAAMFHAVWVRGGIAIHGSDSVDGVARSGGCIRLSQSNAMAFYRLARRVGTRNIRYNWGGYGPNNECASPPSVRQQVLAGRAASTRADRNQAIRDLEQALEGQMAAEGRTRQAPVQGSESPRSVASGSEGDQLKKQKPSKNSKALDDPEKSKGFFHWFKQPF